MKNLQWETLSSEYLHRDSWATLRADTCRMPDGTIISPYYVLEYPDWANAVAVTEEEKVILVRQYRQGAGTTVLEIPGGVIDETDASPEDAIRRELLEETGYLFEEFTELATLYPNASTSNNKTYGFLARHGKKVAEPETEPSEELILEEVSLEELKSILLNNQLGQALHASTVFYALHHLGILK